MVKGILGLLHPKSGTIKIANKRLGYVPQETNNNKDFPISVIDVTLTGLQQKKPKLFYYSKKERLKAEEILELTGVKSLKNKKIGSLSGGQRQRVIIARSLMNDPEILFLDEPTSNIDPKGQQEIFELLKVLNKDLTIAVISHDISLLLGYANKVAHINKHINFHQVDKESLVATEDGHFCEVELINTIAKKQQRGCKC